MIDSLAGAEEILQALQTINALGADPRGNPSWVWFVFLVPLHCA